MPRKVSSATTSPPKAMTSVLPRNAWTYGAAARIHGTNNFESNLIAALGALPSSRAEFARHDVRRRLVMAMVEANAVETTRAAANESFGEAGQGCVGVVAR